MLCYIYTNAYSCTCKTWSETWRFHLQLAVVGKKYLLPALEKEAYDAFEASLSSARGVNDILGVIDGLRAFEDYQDRTFEIIDRRCSGVFLELRKFPEFRALLDSDQELMWQCLEFTMGKVTGEVGEPP